MYIFGNAPRFAKGQVSLVLTLVLPGIAVHRVRKVGSRVGGSTLPTPCGHHRDLHPTRWHAFMMGVTMLQESKISCDCCG